MKVEEIEQKIRDYVQAPKNAPQLSDFGIGVAQAAHAIIEACSADKYDALEVQDAAWHDIEDKHLANLATAQVQVAVMAGLVDEMTTFLLDNENNLIARGIGLEHDIDAFSAKAHNALSAAPKVVCSCESVAKVTTKSNYGRDRPPTSYLRLSDEMGGWNIILKGKCIGDEPIVADGKQVKVIVLDKGEGE